jgi:hypothetical protein
MYALYLSVTDIYTLSAVFNFPGWRHGVVTKEHVPAAEGSDLRPLSLLRLSTTLLPQEKPLLRRSPQHQLSLLDSVLLFFLSSAP